MVEVKNFMHRMELDSGKEYALQYPWRVPRKMSQENIPDGLTPEAFFEALGFNVKVLGNNLVLHEPEGWRKHTKGDETRIYAPDGTAVAFFFVRFATNQTMYGNFERDAKKVAKTIAEETARKVSAWKASLPWWDLRKYL